MLPFLSTIRGQHPWCTRATDLPTPTNNHYTFRAARRDVLISGLAATVAATASRRADASPADASDASLTAAATEGPFHFDARKLRPDITEGRPGVPLAVRFTVLDRALRPWRAARVDIWHCDAQGLYSGYAGQGEDRRLSTEGETFLRGSLLTDAKAWRPSPPSTRAGTTAARRTSISRSSTAPTRCSPRSSSCPMR